MRYFRQVLDFYINSSIHVSLSVVALALVTGYSLHIELPTYVLALLFFCTVTGYNFVKYAEVAGLHHRSLAKSLRKIQVFSAFCAIGLCISIIELRWESLLCIGIFGLLTVLYAVPIVSKKRNLRTVAGLKIYVIALVWSGVTVLLPVIEKGIDMYWDVWVLGIQRFLFIIALMIPFEIRDASFDAQSLKTLPQVVGIKKAKIIGVIWLLLFTTLECLKDSFTVDILVSNGVIVSVLIILIFSSTKKTSNKYFASFWVEGVPLLWLGILYFINYLLH